MIIVVSAPLKDNLLRWGISENKILINPNGVDPVKYNPSIPGSKIRKKYGLENFILIGFIGTFGPFHGVIELAKSIEIFFKLYPEKLNEVKFLLIGDGKLMPGVKRIIERTEFAENVIFTGLTPQSQESKYLAACDILLSPQIRNPDGSKFFCSPVKLFEYMAMGKPIIASDLDQIGEVLEHKKTAYLVEPGNIENLAEAMNVLISDTKLREKLGENARAKVLEKYTWEKDVERVLGKLNQI